MQTECVENLFVHSFVFCFTIQAFQLWDADAHVRVVLVYEFEHTPALTHTHTHARTHTHVLNTQMIKCLTRHCKLTFRVNSNFLTLCIRPTSCMAAFYNGLAQAANM